MPRARVRGGRKAHNKRIRARNEKMKDKYWAFEQLKKKIYEEAKERYLEEQNKQQEIKIKEDDGNNNS
jgi:uncharacterized membrane protein YcaP (DUF421 family)